MDEDDGSDLNATIQGLNFEFNSGDGYNYSFAETTINQSSFMFCLDPEDVDITASRNIRYKYGTEYPLRYYYLDDTLNGNTSLNKVLYLLSTDDGIYSTFQVQTTGGDPIQDVTVTVERNYLPPSNNATYYTIGKTTTDGAGLATFWLNPNYEHKITFVKAGYQTRTEYVVPTEDDYTVQLTAQTTEVSYSGSTEGLSWYFFPGIGAMEPGTYEFGVNITASKANLLGCRFLLYYTNGTQIGNNTGCTSSPYTGGNANVSYAFEDGDRLRGELWLKIDASCTDSICDSGAIEGDAC